jgi:hypothetical protein
MEPNPAILMADSAALVEIWKVVLISCWEGVVQRDTLSGTRPSRQEGTGILKTNFYSLNPLKIII